jgi:trk system potassium uptake protein TrkA
MASQVARHVFDVPEVVCRIYDPVREDAYRRLGLTTVCPTTTMAAQVLEHVLSAADAATNKSGSEA